MGPGCQNFSRQFNDYSNDNDYSKLSQDLFKGDLSIAKENKKEGEI